MITDEDKERVRQAVDIVQLVGETVELRQRGNDFWGCCPFHNEKSPSFHVTPATGLWKCFGCGEGGDVFAYVMKRESLDFLDSIRYLADKTGIELSEERGSIRKGPRRNRLIECLVEAETFYGTMLLRGRGDGADACRRYLSGRGFGSAVCKRWGLGFAPGRSTLIRHLKSKGYTSQEIVAADLALASDRGQLRDRFYDRAMFPIHDEQGRTIGFGGRVLTDAKPKYLNTKDTTVFHKGKHLFAFDKAKEQMVASGTAIVCEGYTDVIAMHEAGFANVVAALGTALTLDHIKMIERFAKRRVICMFDGDAAGQRAAERAVQYIDKTSVELLCVVLPGGQDPAEYLDAKGAEALRTQLAAARPLMSFVFDKRLAGYDLTVPGRRVAALKDMASLLAPLKDSILLDEYATQLADMLGTSVDETKRIIRETPVKREDSARAQRQSSFGTSAPTSAVPPRDDEPPLSMYDDLSYGEYGDEVGTYEESALPPAGIDAPSSLAALSNDERMQVFAEQELLSLMASNPDSIRPYGDRIASFSWADARHESMAWAMLATPAGTAPADAVRAAEGVEPTAARILAGGRLQITSNMTSDQKARFLLDVVELWSCRREVRDIKSKLRSAASGMPDEGQIELFRRATDVQKQINVLSNRLSAGIQS